MATSTFYKVNSFVQDLGAKVHNLSSDSLYLALTNTAPTAATTTYTGLPGELTTGGGYTVGGMAVAGTVTWTNSAGTSTLATTTNTVFTATTGFGPFRYILLYNNTSAGKQAIAYYDYGTSTTLSSGETFTVDLTTNTNILTIS